MALLSVVLPAYNEEMMIDKASECLTNYWAQSILILNLYLSMMVPGIKRGLK